MNFVKISDIYQILLKNLPYLTDFSPQLTACMGMANSVVIA